MIVVRLCGGLGNQLFQYAAARRLAQRHATELVLDLGWYERTPGSNTPRAFELVHYPVKARPATTEEARHCRLYSGRILRRLPLLPRRWRGYRENGYDFDQAVMNLSDDTYLDGYWQSYLYFDDMAARIREELTPYRPAGAQDAELTRSILASNAVSLHVRRGDYVAQKAAATVHGTCTLEYYSAALTYIASRCSDLHFFVFSDDVEWARQNIKPPGQVTIVGHCGPRW